MILYFQQLNPDQPLEPFIARSTSSTTACTRRGSSPAPAGLAAQGNLAEAQRIRYDYDPHRPPPLRFDASGKADRLPELLETAQKRALTEEEARGLAEALRDRQPWLADRFGQG